MSVDVAWLPDNGQIVAGILFYFYSLKNCELIFRLPRKLKVDMEALFNPTSPTSYITSHQVVSQKYHA